MEHRRKLVIACVLAQLAAATAGSEDIDIGGLALDLGMSQAKALERLGVVYKVRHLDELPGNWTVTRRGGPSDEVLGTLSFRDERLTFASKNWVPSKVGLRISSP